MASQALVVMMVMVVVVMGRAEVRFWFENSSDLIF